MRTYRRDPAEVSARRVAEADAVSRRGKHNDAMIGRGDALLHNPVVTAESKAEDDLAASRGAARAIMLRGHGCTGARCGDAAHGDHKAALDDALDALDLLTPQRG